jgi:hypothetical protein
MFYLAHQQALFQAKALGPYYTCKFKKNHNLAAKPLIFHWNPAFAHLLF